MLNGVLLLLRGIKHLLQTTALRKLLLKMLLALLLLSGLLVLVVIYLTSWFAALWLPAGDSWLWQIAAFFVWVGAFIVSASLGIVSYVLFSGMVIAPYLDALAAQLDQTPVSTKSWRIQMQQSAQNALRPLRMLLGWGLFALCCFFIPLIGPIIASVVWFYTCMRFLTFELIDVPCSRRHMTFEERKHLINGRPFFYGGFGLIAMGLMMIPIINILVHPGSVVGLMLHAKSAGLSLARESI